MTPTVLALAALLFAADPSADTKPLRKPHPLAPSLNELTQDEEDKIDDIINRFIKADIGQFKGDEAKQARREFEALGPDAIPALLRGLNRAAQLDHSCPTLMIAKKLARLLGSSDDQKLLGFARDEVGTGVPRNKHAGVLAELRTLCLLRKNALARVNPSGAIATVPLKPGEKAPRNMTNAELVTAASKEGGTHLKTLLLELAQRKGPEVLPGFSAVLKNNDIETQQSVREFLDAHLAQQTAATVKQKLKDTDIEIRRAAVRVVTSAPAFLPDLIDALADEQAEVREEAHKGLLKWSKGEDFGPAADPDKKQLEDAQAKWRNWLTKQVRR